MIEQTLAAPHDRSVDRHDGDRNAADPVRDEHDGDTFWRACNEQLRGELTPQQYSAWIKPLTGISFDPVSRHLRIGAPNRFKLDWVKDQFASRIESIAQRHFDGPIQLDLYLDVKSDTPSQRDAAPARATNGTAHRVNGPFVHVAGGDASSGDRGHGNGASGDAAATRRARRPRRPTPRRPSARGSTPS